MTPVPLKKKKKLKEIFNGRYIKLGINPLCLYLLYNYKAKTNYKINLNKIPTPIKLNNIKKKPGLHTIPSTM